METTVILNLTDTQMRRLHEVANVRSCEAQSALKPKGQTNTYKIVLRHAENEKAQRVVDNALKLSANELANLRKVAKAIQALDAIIDRKTSKDSSLCKTRNDLFASIKESGYQLGKNAGDYKLTKI